MPAPLGTSITDLANGVAGLIVVMSGLFAGGARSLAVLQGLSPEAIDRATALGFLAGAATAVLILVNDLIGG